MPPADQMRKQSEAIATLADATSTFPRKTARKNRPVDSPVEQARLPGAYDDVVGALSASDEIYILPAPAGREPVSPSRWLSMKLQNIRNDAPVDVIAANTIVVALEDPHHPETPICARCQLFEAGTEAARQKSPDATQLDQLPVHGLCTVGASRSSVNVTGKKRARPREL